MRPTNSENTMQTPPVYERLTVVALGPNGQQVLISAYSREDAEREAARLALPGWVVTIEAD